MLHHQVESSVSAKLQYHGSWAMSKGMRYEWEHAVKRFGTEEGRQESLETRIELEDANIPLISCQRLANPAWNFYFVRQVLHLSDSQHTLLLSSHDARPSVPPEQERKELLPQTQRPSLALLASHGDFSLHCVAAREFGSTWKPQGT